MNCEFCEKELEKDEIALNKKMLSRKIKKFMCIACLADYISCTEDDLLVKIEEFKEQGCSLFK